MHKVDSRHTRSKTTQTALMRAAEKLIAARGIENVSIRDIVSAAGQKNESALQYHFKSFTGLIDAIRAHRSEQTQAKRAQLLADLLAHTPTPSLRQVCTMMVQPVFELAQDNVEFRRYIKAFGHELVLTETSPLSKATAHGAGGPSGQQMAHLLREALPHLDANAYLGRMEAAVRLCSASMYHQARQKNAFRGDQADLFLYNLIDGLVGLLGAPISTETKALIDKLEQTN
jgi:AcrR family transcriptional regulator